MGQFEKEKASIKSEMIKELLSVFYPESKEAEYFNFCEVQIAENPTFVHYGTRHLCLSETDKLEVYECIKEESANSIQFFLSLKNEYIDVQMQYTYTKGTGIKRIHTTIENISAVDFHLDYVSSYVNMGFWQHDFRDVDVYMSSNGWYCEAQWGKIPAMDLGIFNGNPLKSMKNFTITNTGTWPTKSALPMLILENKRTQEFMLFNAESNNCWNFELGEIFEGFSLNVSGANREDHGWSLKLSPGEKYSPIDVVYMHERSFEGIINRLTDYRRSILQRNNQAASKVYFNEYMWIAANSPSEEQTLTLSEELLPYGIDYYIIDCGWSDEELDPFYHLGKWEASKTKFKNGFKTLLQNLKKKGYKVGVWIEPEIVGALGDAHELYDDDCYFQRYGKPVIISNRYQLDFRNEKVRNRLDAVVEKIVKEFQVNFIKMDYNIEAKTGTDYQSDNTVAAMETHSRAFQQWLTDISNRYPDLVIETCASGGNRLDSLTLQQSDLVSISDQMYYKRMSHLVSNIFTAVLPEQAGVWCYPAAECGDPITNESVAINMINGIFCVMYLSSRLSNLDETQQALVKEGIEYYRYIAPDKTKMYPYYPMGLSKWDDTMLTFGLKDERKCLLAVYNFGEPQTREINLPGLEIKTIQVAYPKQLPTEFRLRENVLSVNFTQGDGARIFEIVLKQK